MIALTRVLAAGHRGRLALGLALAGAAVLAGLGLLGAIARKRNKAV